MTQEIKNNIATQLVNKNFHHEILYKISDAIYWAWENWDADTLATYYEGEKPTRPTDAFISEWIDNEDFEADGYDVELLNELFA